MPQVQEASNVEDDNLNVEDDNLVMQKQRSQPITDILDWLSSFFGFQVKLFLNVLLSFESEMVP